MDKKTIIKPDYVFEVSWEVCNKIGGIYTVLSSKAPYLVEDFGDQYICIGPDVWKETSDHPDFTEDKELLKDWRLRAENDGHRIRLGRWNIPSSPVAVLVDFTHYFPSKNQILSDFWETYRLDSISGQWDYIEPALFGYAAGRIIESFYEYNFSGYDKFIAHFHEWMTGTGILHLKKNVPQAATIFTTHATVIGRSLAGHGMPLYRDLEIIDAEAFASNHGLRSKYSLERLSALESDCFTTVSEVTARECTHFFGKDNDVITPNGFDIKDMPSAPGDFERLRKAAREKLLNVSRAFFQQDIPRDALMVLTSGRYEYRNKGIDIYIDSLKKLSEDMDKSRMLIAFIMIPANHSGPAPELLESMKNQDLAGPREGAFLTHGLHEPEYDIILKKLSERGLINAADDKLKIVFVPSYLDGRDGIFNMKYYELLAGFDLSIFPSYYEPWGYTPLESLAYGVPTITTSLSGFGQWVKSNKLEEAMLVDVVERTDGNEIAVVEHIAKQIKSFLSLSPDAFPQISAKARDLASKASWSEMISHYHDAFSIALDESELRFDLFKDKQQAESMTSFRTMKPDKPEWKKVLVKPALPKGFEKLQHLSKNLWWSWNSDAHELFRMIDPQAWIKHGENPISLLESLSYEKFKSLSRSRKFMDKLNEVYHRFEAYMNAEKVDSKGQVAYFSMEYGFHDSLKIFSGGLGMLAGDYLKEASDSNVDIVGVGLLYRYGYFQQSLSLFGDQVSELHPQKFSHMPLGPVRNDDGEWLTISIALPGRILYAKAWLVMVGRVKLYLLDTDIPENAPVDRSVTHQLYGGDWENRFKQELLLGVGGIRLINKLGLEASIYHCNEGHAAFIGVERLRRLVQKEKRSFYEALEMVRASTLFTTHTPVPAGHDAFDEDILRTYIPHYADRLNISWDTFMNLGRWQQDKAGEKFSMSVLASRLSQEVNGVSRIHGRVSQQMFKSLYDGYFTDEIHIGYVTNGVHYPTWVSPEWQKLHTATFGQDFMHNQSDKDYWKKIYDVTDEQIWSLRNMHRKVLIDFVKEKLRRDLTRRQENPKLIMASLENIREDVLTIGFARRFATYKRAHLLFSNLDRLKKLVSDIDHPIQFIYAGKAHPADKAGQDLIKRIYEISRMPDFLGRIIFLENYDIALAKKLIQGVDVWLNTPTRPLEASGTSGEKAVMNGVLNCSVLDGWWAEGYREKAGWAIPEGRTYEDQGLQDELDAEILYSLFEDEIIPDFYNRNEEGIPQEWPGYIKNNFAMIAPDFTMKRQLDDYYERFYNPLFVRSKRFVEQPALAGDITRWKKQMCSAWEKIEVLEVKVPDSTARPLEQGESFIAEITLQLAGISADDIGIEVLFGHKENDEVKEIRLKEALKLIEKQGHTAKYRCDIRIETAGVLDYIFRMYPRNDFLPHRQDFNLIRWI